MLLPLPATAAQVFRDPVQRSPDESEWDRTIECIVASTLDAEDAIESNILIPISVVWSLNSKVSITSNTMMNQLLDNVVCKTFCTKCHVLLMKRISVYMY